MRRGLSLAPLLLLAGCSFLGFDADAYKGGDAPNGGAGGAGGVGSGGVDAGGEGGGQSTPHCDDGIKNGAETDTDCGGDLCPLCAVGDGCAIDADCASARCVASTCAAPTCDDGVLNGEETAIDCGGGCPCPDGSVCAIDADCTSGKCESSLCQPPDCFDGVKNGAEGGVDCGGPCPAQCADGTACTVDGDCASSVCQSDICQAPSCSDGAHNGNETDTDCGGGCATKCGTQQSCVNGGDCQSGVCDLGVCVAPGCIDNVKNGAETDTDCGGSMCAPCPTSASCIVAGDCASAVCSGNPKTCAAPSCSDGVSNGGESGTDCGGGVCATCGVGQACTGGSDCASQVCAGSMCAAPSCVDGVHNGAESDLDCGGPMCGPCGDGELCGQGDDCVSGACTSSSCGVWSGRSNGDSHDFQERGSLAPAADGGLLFGAYSASSNLDIGGGPMTPYGGYDGYLAKFNRDGALAWSKKLGGSSNDFVYGVATHTASQRVAIVGAFSGSIQPGATTLSSSGGSDGFVAVYSQSGAHLFSVALGGAGDDELRAVAFTGGGDVVVTGKSASGAGDTWVLRLDGTTGAVVWQRTFSCPDLDIGRAIAVDSANDVIVSGSFGDSGAPLDLGGMVLGNSGGRDAFVAKLASADGAPQWAKGASGALQADGYALLALPGGDVVLAGAARGPVSIAGGPTLPNVNEYDLFFARLGGATGAHVWSVAHGGPGDDEPRQLALDAQGRVVAVGEIAGAADLGTGALTNGGQTDVFAMQIDAATGATTFARTFPGAGADQGQGVAVGVGTGDLFVSGWSNGTLDFGDGPKAKSGVGVGSFWASLGSLL